jgi:hypothetical protein
MKFNLTIPVALVLFVSGGAFEKAAAQQSDPVPGVLSMLASPDVHNRASSFYKLMDLGAGSAGSVGIPAKVQGLLTAYPADAMQAINALSTLLILENTDTTIGTLATSPTDEASIDFYLDLVEAVAALNSQSTEQALLGAIASGPVVTDRLVSFGPAILPSLVPLIYSADFPTRHGTAFALVTMLQPQNQAAFADSNSQSTIRAGLNVAIASFSGPTSFAAAPFRTFIGTLLPLIPGDLNGDGVADCADRALIMTALGSKAGQPRFDIRADVNGDGVVDRADLRAWRKLVRRLDLDCSRDDDEKGD